jgi:glutaminyl-tRNA synthetase
VDPFGLKFDDLIIVIIKLADRTFCETQEKKVAVATAAPPSEEELNPYTIFPQPAENNKVP